jgi:UDP-glucose 4-epimerase
VYGNRRGPAKETDACEPISPYGKHKMLAEEAVRKYGKFHDIAYTIFRPFNVYGPGANSGVVGILADCAREGRTFVLYGPQHRRDFIFIDDVVRTLLMHERMGNATLNLGSGTQTSMPELVEAFRKAAKARGKELKVAKAEDRPGEIDESCADTTELAKHADVKKFVRLEDGLSRCL